MKRSQVLSAVAVLALIVAAKAGAYYEPPSRTAPQLPVEAGCAPGACCAVPVAPPVAAPESADVYAVLKKLEALKVRQKALEREIREAQAQLAEKMSDLRERAAKVAPEDVPAPPTLVPAPASSASYYEPVTTYRMTTVYDEKTGTTRQVATPVTRYVLRQRGAPSGSAIEPPAVPSGELPPQPSTPKESAPPAVPGH